MAAVDLVFRQAPISQPATLIFGEVESIPDYTATLAATLPKLAVSIALGQPVDVTLNATLPGIAPAIALTTITSTTLTGMMPGLQVTVQLNTISALTLAAALPGMTVSMTMVYNSDTARPTVGRVATEFQAGTAASANADSGMQKAAHLPAGTAPRHQSAEPAGNGAASKFEDSKPLRNGSAARHQEAAAVQAEAATSYRNMLRTMRPALDSLWQGAEQLQSSKRTAWQERYHDRRPSLLSSWGEAQRLLARVADDSATALPLEIGRRARYQEAIVPPAGKYMRPVPPAPGEPCYTPPPGNLVRLLFDAAWSGDTNLVFICERHGPTPPGETVIVPVREVYMVINNTTLMKVVGGTKTALPTYSMSMSIDVNSWTWGFSASLPAEVLGELQPASDGTPVELEASINGVPYRMLAEKFSRSRQFGKAAIALTGRGKSAILAAPYAPITNFSNPTARTAQQLMADALTVNGSPIGWSIDWQIEDWLVPAGAWAKQGAYIDALTTIASAAGAFLQPHPTDQVMRVLPRYAMAPWNWDTMVPDYQLPASVTSTEGIEWLDKPSYNRVFVSGVSAGVIAQVTRGGTAGDLLAAQVVDSLITDEVVARQRGRTILSDTGRQAMVSLRLPVLPETGIIVPGKTVRYVDGADIKLGVVRSTGVEANGQPDVWQTIAVETHVEA